MASGRSVRVAIRNEPADACTRARDVVPASPFTDSGRLYPRDRRRGGHSAGAGVNDSLLSHMEQLRRSGDQKGEDRGDVSDQWQKERQKSLPTVSLSLD